VRRRVGLVLLAITALAAAWYGGHWATRIPASAPLLRIAHRGAPETSGAPEGTLAAFRAAIRNGADMLEFDVRLTRDGIPVVLHDETVDRTTNGSGRVADLTLHEVRALDAGGGERIPTVAEVIDLALQAGIPILPEIKEGPQYPGLTAALVELLRSTGSLERSIVQAFETVTLDEVQRLAPGTRTCWLTGIGGLDLSSPPPDAAAVCPAGEMVLLNPGMIRQAHSGGRVVYAWWNVLESGPANRILAAYGVDGIMVDDLGSLP
jgi:glycerophosphoryl diester phosphodiesterase